LDLFDKCKNFTRADDTKAAGFYPYFHAIEENEGPVVHIDGRKIIMAGSNNYLGLTAHPAVKEAAIKAVEKYGTGCSGSRYLTGTLDLHVKLEERLAAFFGREDCLLFSTLRILRLQPNYLHPAPYSLYPKQRTPQRLYRIYLILLNLGMIFSLYNNQGKSLRQDDRRRL